MNAVLHVCVDQFGNRYLMIVSGEKKLLVPILERSYFNLLKEGVPEYERYTH